MELSSILQSLIAKLVTNWIWSLLALAGASGLAYLKKRSSPWVQPIMYALSALTLILVSGWSLKSMQALDAQGPTTPDNLEERVKTWIDSFQYGIQKIPHADAHFRSNITMPSNGRIAVMRTRDHISRYLQSRIQGNLAERDSRPSNGYPL
jgi:hypothetical protein